MDFIEAVIIGLVLGHVLAFVIGAVILIPGALVAMLIRPQWRREMWKQHKRSRSA